MGWAKALLSVTTANIKQRTAQPAWFQSHDSLEERIRRDPSNDSDKNGDDDLKPSSLASTTFLCLCLCLSLRPWNWIRQRFPFPSPLHPFTPRASLVLLEVLWAGDPSRHLTLHLLKVKTLSCLPTTKSLTSPTQPPRCPIVNVHLSNSSAWRSEVFSSLGTCKPPFPGLKCGLEHSCLRKTSGTVTTPHPEQPNFSAPMPCPTSSIYSSPCRLFLPISRAKPSLQSWFLPDLLKQPQCLRPGCQMVARSLWKCNWHDVLSHIFTSSPPCCWAGGCSLITAPGFPPDSPKPTALLPRAFLCRSPANIISPAASRTCSGLIQC